MLLNFAFKIHNYFVGIMADLPLMGILDILNTLLRNVSRFIKVIVNANKKYSYVDIYIPRYLPYHHRGCYIFMKVVF